jgi:hypothetical protein
MNEKIGTVEKKDFIYFKGRYFLIIVINIILFKEDCASAVHAYLRFLFRTRAELGAEWLYRLCVIFFERG